jgi:Domain of unknown function (DUF3854)
VQVITQAPQRFDHIEVPRKPLFERHRAELHASAVPDALIDQEQIASVSTRGEAARLGYREDWQQLVPAIAYAVHPPDRSNGLYVLKPDRPRPRKDKPGKVVKYEWPYKQPHRLDIPLACMQWLDDPTVDVYVVEGKKKALAILAHKLARGERCVVVCVWGVWAWGKKPDANSLVQLLFDWDYIPLEGRQVFVVFDSDRDEKENVDLAARQLADRLAERRAQVYHVKLPGEPDGRRNGADDLIERHGGEAFEQCVEDALERGAHGTEALRAAWRRQRAEIRELRERFVAISALDEVPTELMDGNAKAALRTTAAEMVKRANDRGSTDYRPIDNTTMGRRSGLSAGTYGRKLDGFCSDGLRLFEKDRARACVNVKCRRRLEPGETDCPACGEANDPRDPRRPTFLRLVREGCSTYSAILWAAITSVAPKEGNTWGGRARGQGRKTLPACAQHPEADLIRLSQYVCAECHAFVGEPTQRTEHRNNQVDCSASDDDVVDVEQPSDEGNNQVDCSPNETSGDDHVPTPTHVAIRNQVDCFGSHERHRRPDCTRAQTWPDGRCDTCWPSPMTVFAVRQAHA